jgi:hypothetical protein
MNVKRKSKIEESWLLTGGAFLGAFASKYVDYSLRYKFPLNILGLIFSAVIILLIARYTVLD